MPKHNWRFKDETKNRFGMLCVVSYDHTNNSGQAMWKCRCDCGKTTIAGGKLLRAGITKSCGCLHEWTIKSGNNTRKHGHTSGNKFTREYTSWAGAKYRCLAKTCRGYKNYGGRGITMCPKWIGSFEAFLKDMGSCPDGMMLDRINNDGNYEPSNCRWVDRTAQNNNKRNNHRIVFKGQNKTIAEWATEIGIDQKTIWKRIVRGWTLERTLRA